MSITIHSVQADALIKLAEFLESDAQRCLSAWAILGQDDQYFEQMSIARALRTAAATKRISDRREFLRGAGFVLVGRAA